jgi:uncharacterized protein (DUF427 family)
MATRVRDALMDRLGELRYEPTAKRIRGTVGSATIVDSRRALLVWEPRRVVPSYAVPRDDVAAEIAAVPGGPDPAAASRPGLRLGEHRVYDPSVPFVVHTTPGEPVVVRAEGREAAAFRPHDPALAGYVILDFDGFDAWYEEEERNVSHPRDPFHRVDVLSSTRHVVVSLDGAVLADSRRPALLFETHLPVRSYLPIEDVRTDLLQPSATTTWCAYKGQASYWSHADAPDLAWTYHQPLREAAAVAGLVAFFDERVDVVVDGRPVPRPVTPWSPESRRR